MKPLPMRIRRFCAFITGVVFFLSGIFKLLDPVGAGLVMEDYYRFFHLDFLVFSAKPVALVLALLETVTGAALITGLWRKVTAIAASVLLGFFTLLTLVLVIFNPVMDCGCFGEVIHLTHMETFVKNLILCALALAAFLPYRDFGHNRRRKYVSFTMVMAGVIAFTVYSLLYIPLVNYTDFKPASRLLAAERFHETDGEDMFDYVLVYEKGGKQKEFSLENLPDSTWTFVESKAVPKIGYRQEIFPELSFTDAAGEYRSELAIQHNVMVLSVYRTGSVNRAKWEKAAYFIETARSYGFFPILLVSSYPQAFQTALEKSGLDTDIADYLYENAYYADYKALISMNRSNGGVTCFDNGYLVRKLSYLNMPDADDLGEQASGDITETLLDFSTSGNLTFKGFLLYCFAVMLLL